MSWQSKNYNCKMLSSYCLSAISLFALHRQGNISNNMTLSFVLTPPVCSCTEENVWEWEVHISDPSTLNLLVLLLWHYTDRKPHNSNISDKKKRNYPV